MSFSKRIIVLKELENRFSINGKKLSGIVRIEQTNGVSELYLSTLNLGAITFGALFLLVADSSKTIYSFDLDLRPYAHGKTFSDTPNIDKGFCAGLCFVKDDLPITVAFGMTEDCPIALIEFKKLVAEHCLNMLKKRQREEQERAQEVIEYDDEAVATENFYALNDQIKNKLSKIQENSYAYLRDQDAMPFEPCSQETEKSSSTTCNCQNETDYDNSQKYSKSNPYYLTVKNELDEVFEKFPPDKKLNSFFADSRWVRVKYAENKYYVVGIVKEDGQEKYICYGVPEKYSPEPPQALKDCATFIPISIFDLKGDGYWMMFQDAITGTCIRLKKV